MLWGNYDPHESLLVLNRATRKFAHRNNLAAALRLSLVKPMSAITSRIDASKAGKCLSACRAAHFRGAFLLYKAAARAPEISLGTFFPSNTTAPGAALGIA